MNKHIRLVALCTVCALLIACGDETSRFKKDFIRGCLDGPAGLSIAQCECMFSELNQRYSIQELKDIEARRQVSSALLLAMEQAGKACLNVPYQ